MHLRSSCPSTPLAFRLLFQGLLFLLFVALSSAQTAKPLVFTGGTLNNAPAIAVFTRDDTSGPLTPVANSPFAVREVPDSFALDEQARFLFAICGPRVCMYQLDKDMGAIQEVPTPLSAQRPQPTPSSSPRKRLVSSFTW